MTWVKHGEKSQSESHGFWSFKWKLTAHFNKGISTIFHINSEKIVEGNKEDLILKGPGLITVTVTIILYLIHGDHRRPFWAIMISAEVHGKLLLNFHVILM